jgi:hypothetical protein
MVANYPFPVPKEYQLFRGSHSLPDAVTNHIANFSRLGKAVADVATELGLSVHQVRKYWPSDVPLRLKKRGRPKKKHQQVGSPRIPRVIHTEIIELARKRYTRHEVAERLQLPFSVVSEHWAKIFPLKVRGKKANPDRAKYILEVYRQCLTLEEAAGRLGLTRERVRQVVDQYGTGTDLKRGLIASACNAIERQIKTQLKPPVACPTEYEKHPLCSCWHNMISRCENKNHPSYKDYGGRGIKVCERWRNSIQAFIEDMGPKPTPKHSIDRIENNLGYYPGNVQWSTMKQQANNRRPPKNHKKYNLVINNHTYTSFPEISRKFGLKAETIKARYLSGKTGLDLVKPVSSP